MGERGEGVCMRVYACVSWVYIRDSWSIRVCTYGGFSRNPGVLLFGKTPTSDTPREGVLLPTPGQLLELTHIIKDKFRGLVSICADSQIEQA